VLLNADGEVRLLIPGAGASTAGVLVNLNPPADCDRAMIMSRVYQRRVRHM